MDVENNMNLITCIFENDNSNEEQDSNMLYWAFLAPHTTIKQKKNIHRWTTIASNVFK